MEEQIGKGKRMAKSRNGLMKTFLGGCGNPL
jgi:hypothetical protein